jgi:hypothetical protein
VLGFRKKEVFNEMKHHHHQMLLHQHSQQRILHHHQNAGIPTTAMPNTTPQQSVGQQPSYVVVTPPPSIPKSLRSSSHHSAEVSFLAMIGLFFIIIFFIYLVGSMSFGPQFFQLDDDIDSRPSSRGLRNSRQQYMQKNQQQQIVDDENDPGKCIHQLEAERRTKTSLMDQVRTLEADLTEERKKFRELEQDYRDLALSSRAQTKPAQQMNTGESTGDVSAMQRLSKCRTAVDESTQTIKELREHNKNLDAQVTRLQKELREAILDADEQERLATDCERRSNGVGANKGNSHHPPPPK